MTKANIYNKDGEIVEEMTLSSKIFGLKVNESLVHQAVVAQMANERQVLAHTKVISEVSGSGKKPWKQKGTGRARVGSVRSPLWRGGGIIFGPTKDRNFKKELNGKMKQKALFMALSDKLTNNSIVIIDDWKMEEFKTKQMNDLINKIETKVLGFEKAKKAKRKMLLVADNIDQKAKFSARNLEGITVINKDNINIVEILKNKQLITTKEVINNLEKVYNK